jgi:DNA-binding NtrC family response regulator
VSSRPSGALVLQGPNGERARDCSIIIVCSDPVTPEIVAALEVLRELADTTVGSGDDAGRLLAHLDADVIVADEWVGTKSGRELLAAVLRRRPWAIGIVLESSPNRAASPHLDRLTVLPKPVDPGTLRAVCALGLECAALRRRLRTFEVGNGGSHAASVDRLDTLECYEGLIVRSTAMRAVLRTLRELEASDVAVLIQGETGTGKELVARAIHARSGRKDGPFLPINLGAISESLRESELFGHVRGAFTGANGTRGGFFLTADGGSIFLDEVGEASPALQVALLRVLEEGTITPVGADRARPVDVRVISATNQNLAQLVREGRFRRDLYYRLNVFPVRIPPLRERVEDVFPLATHFLRRASRPSGRQPTGISHEAQRALEAHPWEGNVRELRSVMERAAVVCKGGPIMAADLPLGADGEDSQPYFPSIALLANGTTLREIERQILVRTLALADGNQSQAARLLGLHESTLRFRMRRAGIAAPRRTSSS